MNFNKAEFNKSYGTFAQLPESTELEFAFSGRSNVGKSSLINKIFNRKSLAKVSSVPGKTVTINFYNLDGCHLVDLPGYGFARVAKFDKERWTGLIEGYLSSDRNIALIFQLIDIRHAPSKDDIMMINFLIETESPFIIVFTKADKLSKRQREERMEGFKSEIPNFNDITSIIFSSQTGEGVEDIRKIIEDLTNNEE